nr:P2X purinoceptor 7-like [Misgurnus anguillicaudatus]XP_055062958.1 P2X purinoceptor 7-like [Misgurnus anguillicaudatus]
MENDWSDASSFTTELSFEVEDFSPPPSPEVEEGELSVDTAGPEPYQFEPLAQTAVLTPETRSASDDASEAATQGRMGPVSEWCTCGHCSSLSLVENVCCREIPKVVHRCDQIGGVGCITAHPGFEPVALNPYVLQAVYGTYVQLYGEMGETVTNSAYRHLAYRNVVRWCWGYLGQHIRVVIPSCVVTRIREEFPEEGPYRGFLPPLHF